MEEAGLNVEIIKDLPSFEYQNNEGDVKVFMYLMKANSLDLKIEREGDILEWVPVDRVAEILSYKNTKDYFNSIQTLV